MAKDFEYVSFRPDCNEDRTLSLNPDERIEKKSLYFSWKNNVYNFDTIIHT